MAPLFESGMSTNSIISANTGGGATPSFERPARCSLPHVDWRLVYLVPAPRPAAVIVLSGARRVFSTPYLSFGLLETENQNESIFYLSTADHLLAVVSSKLKCQLTSHYWYRRQDLNLHAIGHLILSQARLPFRHTGI